MGKFLPGHPKLGGNKRGSTHQLTKAKARNFIQFFGEMAETDDYQQNAKRRIFSGRAPHLETYGLKQVYGEADVNVKGDITFRWASE